MLTDSSTRLNKYISESGICSRRDADRYIEQGNVFINGKRATVGAQVFAGDVVKVNGQLIEPRDEDDLVLIAGKGHEDYQLVGNRRLDYSDRLTVARLLGVMA